MLTYKDYKKIIDKIVWFIPIRNYRDYIRILLMDIVNTIYRIENINNVLNTKNNNNVEELAIIEVQGGLSDQVHKYILGESIKIYCDKKVKYDLTFYEEYGTDCLGNRNRPFELLEFLPEINFDIASQQEISTYKTCFYEPKYCHNYLYELNDLLINKRQIYVSGYPYHPLPINIEELFSNIDLDKYHYNKLKDDNLDLYKEMKQHIASVSVHVRLGDSNTMDSFSSKFNKDYNNYANYIIQSINLMTIKLNPIKPKFFFFSDDIEWVKKNIILKLHNTDYIINNNINKGYIDMYLISSSKHSIISIGGFGRTANYFNKNKDKIIISPDNINSL